MTTTEHTLETFLQHYPTNSYDHKSLILQAGDPNDFFYYIESGAVKMVRTSPQGSVIVLHIFFPGSFFSLLTLVDYYHNDYDFITLIPTTIRKVPKSELIAFLKQHNDILYDLQLRLLKGLDGLLKRIERSTFYSAYQQVANLLIYFSQHFSEQNSHIGHTSKVLKIKITHQEIAEWLGLSRENVSIQMKQLEKKGLIKNNHHFIEIPNVDALRNV